MDHEQIKITILIIADVLCGRLKCRALHYTPALVVAVTDRTNEAVVALEQFLGPIPPLDPPTSLTTEICRFIDHFFIYHWDNFQ